MKSEHYDIVVVGAGLAGMAAAVIFKQHGLNFLVIDENPHPGGQLIRKQPHGEQSSLDGYQDAVKKCGHKLRKEFELDSHFLQAARILGIFEACNLCLEDNLGQSRLISAEYILLATGAREHFMPFKGWTLPGVLALGAAQIMMKSSGILPGRKTVVAGAGPLLYTMAGQVVRCGGDVPLLLDRASRREQAAFFKLFPPQLAKLPEGLQNMLALKRHGSRMLTRHAVVEARGDGQVEEVVYARISRTGRVIPKSEATISADSLAIGQGFVANTELAASAGCELEFNQNLGGWIVAVDEQLKTSFSRIYAAGEITGIGGGEQSLREGELAALAIVSALGVQIGDSPLRIRKLQKYRQAQKGFNRFLANLAEVPSGCWEDLPDETILCRCEDVSFGDVRRALTLGLDSISLLKRGTRISMGRCQGRTCTPIINALLKANKLTATTPNIRFPVKPVLLSALECLGHDQ